MFLHTMEWKNFEVDVLKDRALAHQPTAMTVTCWWAKTQNVHIQVNGDY